MLVPLPGDGRPHVESVREVSSVLALCPCLLLLLLLLSASAVQLYEWERCLPLQSRPPLLSLLHLLHHRVKGG